MLLKLDFLFKFLIICKLAASPLGAAPHQLRNPSLGHLFLFIISPVCGIDRKLTYEFCVYQQNLVKQCMSHETEYALHKMTGIAQHINDMKKRHEHTVRVQVSCIQFCRLVIFKTEISFVFWFRKNFPTPSPHLPCKAKSYDYRWVVKAIQLTRVCILV